MKMRLRPHLRRILVALGLVAVFVLALVTYGLASAWFSSDDALNQARNLPVPPAFLDRTLQFQALREGGTFDVPAIEERFAALQPRLADVHFILVPSYLSDFLDVPHTLGIIDYFGDQERGLREAGYGVTVVDTESEASAADNARLIAAIADQGDRRLCFITHSKGGLDTLVFLLQADAAVRERVVCWVAFQAPFAGSPIADGVASQALLRWPSEQALALFGGSGQSLHDLRTDLRVAHLADQADAIGGLVATIPVLSVAGAVDGPPGLSIHYPTTSWMQSQGIRNDGIVPTWSAVLPGTPYVVVDGLDHTGAVLNHWFNEPRDRIAMTKALLVLALENPQF